MKRISARWLYVALAIVLLFAVAACTRKSSTLVDTNEMEVSFSAVSDGSGTTIVRASLSTEDVLLNSSPSVRLSSRDELRAMSIDPVTSAVDEQIMVGRTVGSRYRYEAMLTGQAKDTLIEVALDRSRSSKRSAPDSFVRLPAPFELDWVEDPILLTPAPVNFSRSSATPLFVIWDPFDAPDFEPGDELSFRVTGTCIRNYFGVLDWENGEDVLELTGGVLVDSGPPNNGLSCPIEVELTLRRRGTTDPEYLFGRFNAYQVRVLTLLSAP